MVNELCKLAPSGMSIWQMLFCAFSVISMSLALFILLKKYKIGVKWMLLGLLFVFSLTLTTTRQTVFAQSAQNCPEVPVNGSINQPGNSGLVAGRLNDDNPTLSFDNNNSIYSARFSVLQNDNAPSGDTFDINTLRLLGAYPEPGVDHSYLILDPNNPTPPTTPSSPMNSDWANVWGRWVLDLTCNPADTAHCSTNPGGGVDCLDPSSGGTCWPTGYVYVELWSNAQSGTYFIPYTVNTVSGKTLAPANISVDLFVSPIYSYSDNYTIGTCESWPTGSFSLNLVNSVSVNPGSNVDLSTFDLNPTTPGVDSNITIYNENYPANYVTLSVDSSGIVTMINPTGGTPGYTDDYSFDFNVKDTDGNISNTSTLTLQFRCSPPE